MAEVRPFQAVRYDAARVDVATTIAPPYDVISPAQQGQLYNRSPHNIVRVEYGEQFGDDSLTSNRYTRAASDLAGWLAEGVLLRESRPTMYEYRLSFEWDGEWHERAHYFALVRLEEWDKAVIKPHEQTLSGPKADRLELLRSTRTQVSPVFCLYRASNLAVAPRTSVGEPLYDIEADGQRHALTTISDRSAQKALQAYFAGCDFYIADGHHRYETALAYRDERRAAASSWTGEEPENFVLMAFTDASDPGLLVLPTHRLVHTPIPPVALDRLRSAFDVRRLGDGVNLHSCLAELAEAAHGSTTAVLAYGLEVRATHLLTLRDRTVVENGMPPIQSAAWKELDVNVLQYGVFAALLGIDDEDMRAGKAVSYIQDPSMAVAAVDGGSATCAFLLNATPVDQMLAVSDANGRMPQKSTYFYPKLPTGLLLNVLA